MVKRLLLILLLIGCMARAQQVDTLNGTFDDKFRSLQVVANGNRLAPPIITLDTNDWLTVSFDQLADDRSYLRYRLIHCNADWQPSILQESEYVDGFNFDNIDDWDYSRIAYTNYIHYRITLPNDNMAMTVSGNYLLQVYDEDDPDTVLLQARFMVSEETAKVNAGVLSVTDIDYNDSHQQVSVFVDATNARVEDTFNDLMLTVTQNGRVDNEVTLRQPLRIDGKKAWYEHLRPLIFEAGNEYRRMETVSTTYPGMHVEHIEFHEPYFYAILQTDHPRSASHYEYDRTQHGRYFIREYNSERSDIEADYMVTIFTLEMPEIEGRQVFLDGDFTGRRFDSSSLMNYNRATGCYEKAMLLKQGAYNYQYLVTEPGSSRGETLPIEGNYYPTGNEYLVKVYHRPRGERYDRLIGVTATYF